MRYIAGTGLINCDLLYSGVKKIPEEGTEIYSRAFDMQFGGGTPAEMIKLHQLNVPTSLATFIGSDIFSLFARNYLDQSGLDYVNLYKGSGIPVNITSVLITDRDRTFVTYAGTPELDDDMKERIFELHKDASIIKISPSLTDVYREIKKYNSRVIMVLDVGWSESLSLETLSDCMELADYFLPNSKEAMKITSADTPEAAAEILGSYFNTAIVKLGPAGCLLRENGRITYVPALPVHHVLDSTGAGDSYLSGFLYGLYHGRDILDCLIYGNATGGRCVEQVGCLSATLSEEQLKADAEIIKALL